MALLVRAHTPADRCFLVSWAAQLKRLCMDGGTNTFAPDEPKHTHSPIMVRWLCALFVAGAILSFYALLSQTTVRLLPILGKLFAEQPSHALDAHVRLFQSLMG